jgi:hypothetical protein
MLVELLLMVRKYLVLYRFRGISQTLERKVPCVADTLKVDPQTTPKCIQGAPAEAYLCE